MCGIIGYVGNKDISSVLISGLERLSYRGYDSSGIGVISKGEINIWKKAGKITVLKEHVKNLSIKSNIGIGHTRWATHGEVNDTNAHPLKSKDGKIALVHNGIIENYLEIKNRLKKKGYFFKSSTDSEVILNLYQDHLTNLNSLLEKEDNHIKALRKTMGELEGSYSIAIINEDKKNEILLTRKESPLIIGIGSDGKENYICSDINVLLFYTRKYIELEEGEIAIVKADRVEILGSDDQAMEKKPLTVDWEVKLSEKGNYEHFMLKEIHEQPSIIRKILSNYVRENEIIFDKANFLFAKGFDINNLHRFIIQACGTSWHAGLIGKYWLEKFTHTITEIDISSELRYRNFHYQRNDIILALSQSGETADTLACLREAKGYFLKSVSFINVQGSAIDRESDGSIYSLAGQEIGVASTKNYLAQLVLLFLFSLKVGLSKKIIDQGTFTSYLKDLNTLPSVLEKVMQQEEKIKKLAQKYHTKKGFIFIGRGTNYPNALEGALKLKEISYIHATGYAAGELKHGPLALIDSETPVICIIPDGEIYKKNLSNLLEVKTRQGNIIAIATEGNTEISEICDEVIFIPKINEDLTPAVTIIPLQLISYYIAFYLGRNIDQPKNLAKSVTVE